MMFNVSTNVFAKHLSQDHRDGSWKNLIAGEIERHRRESLSKAISVSAEPQAMVDDDER